MGKATTVAVVGGGVLARVDGNIVTASAVTVHAQGSNFAFAKSDTLSVGLIGGGVGATSDAQVTQHATVQAVVGERRKKLILIQ